MSEEEKMREFEEERGLPHLPPDPPPPADPANPTRDEAQASLDHMVACMGVLARQDTSLGRHDEAALYRLAAKQFALLGRAVMTAGGDDAVPPEAWAEITRQGEALRRRARRLRDEDDRG